MTTNTDTTRTAHNTGHTPGPWKVDQLPNLYITVYQDTGNFSGREKIVANIPGRQAEANARLIASAPELLAALEQIQFIAGGAADEANREQIRCIVETALAKATGGSQ